MPKHDFFSPKAVANRMKAKGLQKLRWWCEACEKQCRDENGFKCHQTSEGHLRQMKLFAENPQLAIQRYSEAFEKNFLDLLSRRFGTKRVEANAAYREYISDKQHVHMNATRWTTLTTFVQYLGKQGHCVVDETEKGWYVQWIDKDPAALARQAAAAKKRRHDADDEERAAKELKKRVKATPREEALSSPGARLETSNVAVSLLPAARRDDNFLTTRRRPSFLPFASSGDDQKNTPTKKPSDDHTKKMIDRLMTTKQDRAKESSWLLAGVVVKVVRRELAAYHNKKGTVLRLDGPFAAVVAMLDSGDELRLDQADLETVIPNKGKPVALLRGRHRGQLASVVDLHLDAFAVAVKILPGQPDAGTLLDAVPYEHLSKAAPRLLLPPGDDHRDK